MTAGWLRGLPAGLVLAVGCSGPSAPPPIEMGIPLELAEHRVRTLSNLRYRISLEIPDDRTEAITGRSLIAFEWEDPDQHPLVLDFLHPEERVESVRVNTVEVAWRAVDDHVVIDAVDLRAGSNEVDIRYAAGDEALNRSDEFMYALFVPDRAHFSLPLFDQPNLKGSVRWTVTAPASWSVVANGPSADQSIYPDRTLHTFAETRPIPTYLFAVAAGEFEVEEATVGDRLIRMYHRETDAAKVARNRDEIFALHASALEWLEDYTEIDYPFQKFDFVLIPSFQYGGMEHPGGILYRQAGLMLDENATQGQILGRASVIAHETAHMWFGDLVTMNWFDDVWTKEVFANFMAAKIVHPAFPELDHDLRFLTAHHPSAYAVDRTAGANPIRQPLENLRFAGTLYGSIIYQKAPVVMRHLEARVGEELFRDGLREYLATYSYGNATWPDLIAILDARSDQDLEAWSRVWVDEPGRPTIRVTRDGDDALLTPSDPTGQDRVWPQSLSVRFGSAAESQVFDIELGRDPVRIPGAGGAEYILPNGSGLEYGAFILDSSGADYLLGSVADLETARLRGAVWVTLWDQVLESDLPPADFLAAAMAALPAETDELILGRLLGYVSPAFWRLSTEAQREAVGPALEALLWQEASGSRPVRARAAFLSSFRGVALSEVGVSRVRGLWDGSIQLDGLNQSENDQTALATQLALRAVPDAESILDAQAERITNADRRARFDFVRPSLSGDPAIREAFFTSLAEIENRAQEPWVLSGMSNLHHPLRAEESADLIDPALGMIEEIQRTGDIFFPGRWLDATLGGHGSVAVVDAIDAFLSAHPELSPRLRLKIEQSADMVRRAARIRADS